MAGRRPTRELVTTTAHSAKLLPPAKKNPAASGGARPPQISFPNLNREDGSRYNRLQTNRLISTTTVDMISVDARSTSNLPESLARLIVLPRPAVETIFP